MVYLIADRCSERLRPHRGYIMARKAIGPRYFDSKGGYYVTVRGERVCLAKGPKDDPDVLKEAETKYHRTMLTVPISVAGDRSTCKEILDRYLAHAKAHRKPKTYALWERMCNTFNAELGGVRVCNLKLHMVTAWLDRMESARPHKTRGTTRWGSGTRAIAISVIKAGFNWAVEQEMTTRNPVARLKKPGARSRGGDQLLTEEGHSKLLAEAHPCLCDFLVALNDTGARPGEIARVTAADFNADISAWVL